MSEPPSLPHGYPLNCQRLVRLHDGRRVFIRPMLPGVEEFPYAIRQVSEALSSNGSTSMGSVCASTLALRP